MAPDLDHSVVYGTAGTASTKSIGAYFALPLRFVKLVLTAPAVVLENEGYDLLIGTQFLKEFDGIVNHQEGFVSLLGYRVSLASNIAPTTKGLRKRRVMGINAITWLGPAQPSSAEQACQRAAQSDPATQFPRTDGPHAHS